VVKLNKVGATSFIRAIDEEYRVHWVVDNLPVGMFNTNADRETVFSRGFPVGFHTGPAKKQFKHYIYNHVRIIISYHDDKGGEGEDVTTKIVGFRVEPMSIKHTWEGDEFKEGTTVLKTCNSQTPPTNDPKNYMSVDRVGDTVVFSYDVFWEKSDTEWTSRWDAYLLANAPNDKVRRPRNVSCHS
jgi:transmembrane 9 superfamily protein 2/4